MNPALEEIEQTAQGQATAEKYRVISRRYLRLAQDLSALDLKDASLKTQLGQYIKLLERIGECVGRLARAYDERKPRPSNIERELRRLDDRHRSMSQQIDGICLGGDRL